MSIKCLLDPCTLIWNRIFCVSRIPSTGSRIPDPSPMFQDCIIYLSKWCFFYFSFCDFIEPPTAAEASGGVQRNRAAMVLFASNTGIFLLQSAIDIFVVRFSIYLLCFEKCVGVFTSLSLVISPIHRDPDYAQNKNINQILFGFDHGLGIPMRIRILSQRHGSEDPDPYQPTKCLGSATLLTVRFNHCCLVRSI